MNLLIVDDKKENLLAMEHLLAPLGATTITATSGTQALEILLKQDMAMVLLDVQMPGMDGFETAKLMRGVEKGKEVPIIFVTALSKEDEYIFKGYDAGAVEYLTKPINPVILKSKVKVFLELHRRKLKLQEEIEARKAAERFQSQLLKQRNDAYKELNEFAHIVSHDLKAPLRAITILTHKTIDLYHDTFDDAGRERMEMIVESAERMQGLIDGVLKYSMAGKAGFSMEEIELNELIQEVVRNIKPPDHIRIKVKKGFPQAQGEKLLIMQVIQNLLTNAITSIDKPEGEVFIGFKENGNYLQVSVSDNGPGIEEKHFSRIFTIFVSLPGEKKHKSSGVGLSIVKKIIERHKGEIWVESVMGKGSTFNFTLPLQDS